MYWTLELASKLEDAPWPATKEELIDYATRSGAPLEVIENLEEIEAKTTSSSTRRSIDLVKISEYGLTLTKSGLYYKSLFVFYSIIYFSYFLIFFIE